MAGLLELAQLLEHDRVAEVDVGRGRVDAELDPQRPPAASCSSSLPSGSTSTALRVRSATGAMLDCRLRSAGPARRA